MSNSIQSINRKTHDCKQDKFEDVQSDISKKIITTRWYFKLLPRRELESLILEAAEKSAINQCGSGRMFSTNDLYLNISVGDTAVFKTAQKGTIWEDRFNLISLGIVQYTLKSHGYSSIKRGGGVNVRRWYKLDVEADRAEGMRG